MERQDALRQIKVEKARVKRPGVPGMFTSCRKWQPCPGVHVRQLIALPSFMRSCRNRRLRQLHLPGRSGRTHLLHPRWGRKTARLRIGFLRHQRIGLLSHAKASRCPPRQ